jgi:hypothetical protein
MQAINSLMKTLTTFLRALLYFPFTSARGLRAGEWGDFAMSRKASALLIAILFSPSWTIGQSTFGDIVGLVKDPSQGAVPEAQVVLTRVEDRSQYPVTTDADGAFISSISSRDTMNWW